VTARRSVFASGAGQGTGTAAMEESMIAKPATAEVNISSLHYCE